MKRLCPVLMLVLAMCVLSPLRADEAADKAKFQDQIEKTTQAIATGSDEHSLINALYDRAFAYNALDQWNKAAVDIDAALAHVQKLPLPQQAGDAARVWVLKAEIALNLGKWDEAIKGYEAAQQIDGFENRIKAVGVCYYNLSRAYAHADYPWKSHVAADHAIAAMEGKADEGEPKVRSLALRQRAIARYGEGDLAGAKADWEAARAGGLKLGDAPFDEAQAPLNKAVVSGHDKERIARARFLMAKADSLSRRRTEAWEIGVKDVDMPTENGGTLSLADATQVGGTPRSLVDDALNDIEMAIHRDIGEDSALKVFNIALERGRAWAMRFQMDTDDTRKSANDVDEELNRAVKLRPLDLDARRARAEWLVFRLDHLNGMASKAKMTIEARKKTRAALLFVSNDDLGRVLLADPNDVARHIVRARLSMDQPLAAIADARLLGAPGETKTPYSDSHAILFDLDAALAARTADGGQIISLDEKWRVNKQRDEQIAAQNKLKPEGSALEWKTKGNAAGVNKDFDTALEAFNTALRIDPKFADALNNRANCYRQRAQWDLALRDLDEAIAIEPKHRIAYLNRAGIKRDVGDFDGSVRDARRAVEVAPDDTMRHSANEELVRALFARADSRSDTKETFASAFDDYHESNTLAAAIKLAPNATMLQYEGTMAAEIGRGTEAMTALRAAHAASPDDVWIEGWLTVVATALSDGDAPALEKEIITHGDRSTLSNIDDLAISLRRVSPRLTTQPDAEESRLNTLHDRLFKAYNAKPAGVVAGT